MKNKIQLLENLIREGHISLDEALILLESEKEYIYVNNTPYVPYYPAQPLEPYYGDFFKGTCSGATGNISASDTLTGHPRLTSN